MRIPDGLKNFIKYGSTRARVTALALCLFCATVLIVFIVKLLIPEKKSDSHINVTNLSKDISLPRAYLENIQKTIWYRLSSELDLSGAHYEDAVIREGSYSESTSGDIVSAKMIIDLEALHYSFAVTYSYNKKSRVYDDPNITITCPHYTEVIYKDKKCIATTPDIQLERYLPHYDYLPGTDTKYAASFKKNGGSSYLAVEVASCGNQAIKDSAVSSVKSWLKSIYLDPNDYKIDTLDVCKK